MFVKICGLQSDLDVDAAVAAGTDAVGFVFYPGSVRNVSVATAVAACAGLATGIKRVAVMLHPSNAEWSEVLNGFGPDVLQTDAADFSTLDVPASIERWPVHREGVHASVDTPTFLFEGAKSGQGETGDWEAAATLAHAGNMILAGGLKVENVATAIAAVRPFGVDVSSGVESSPGNKDPQRIANFIKAAKAAGTRL